jgi:hypothetical protein
MRWNIAILPMAMRLTSTTGRGHPSEALRYPAGPPAHGWEPVPLAKQER